ncbi:MAG: hypothetical protein PHW24_02935 [Candidatus Moranbacteria bacterium]|nr:hypothetical protein [Candidatus Moranbacteria bacterium]
MLVSLVFIGGICSLVEGTFYPGQSTDNKIKLWFVLHGGVVFGDLILIPLAVWMWYESINFSLGRLLITCPLAIAITWFCHRGWWFACKDQPGYMYPNQKYSKGDPKFWYRDLPVSAWIHVVYMIVSTMWIAEYIFNPMPADVVKKTFDIFVAFVPLAIIEPGIVQGWPPTKKDITNSCTIAVGLWVLIGLVTWGKLVHWWIF